MDLDKALSEHRDLYLFVGSDGRAMFKLLDYETYRSISYIMLAYPEFKFDMEDKVWDECILEHTFTNGKDYLPAGLVTTISQLILYLSCPSDLEEFNAQLTDARGLVEDAREQAILTICEAFPSYTPEVLEKVTWNTLMRRLAQSEVILKRQFEFKDAASQHQDDSAKIFDRLNENISVDFSKSNRMLAEDDLGAPAGDFNLRNIRGN